MLLLIICLSALRMQVMAAECLPLTVRNADGNYIVPGAMGDIVYRRINGGELALDAYVQKRGDKRPAVVVIHGGNWDTGSRMAFVGQFLELLTRAGYNWFSIDYRLNGLANYKQSVDDLRAAVEFIRCHAREFRIDPDNIALFGEDAGAQLALMLAAEKTAGVKAVVSIGGFYDLRESANLKSNFPESLLAEASLISKELKAMPPTLVVHGGNDRESPAQQAGKFCEALRVAGGDCEYVLADGAIHRAENWWPSQWGYKGLVKTWLAKQLKLGAAEHQPYVTNLQKDVVYDARHNLKLDAYIPTGKGPHPAVVIVHGGGWEAGDKVTYVTPLFEPLAKAGFAWFSIDYRLTPQVRHPDQIADLQKAIGFVRDYSKTFRIDPNRLAVIGESASGQIVALSAVKSGSSSYGRPSANRRSGQSPGINPERFASISAAVSFYGVYDFEPMAKELTPRSVPVRLFGLNHFDDLLPLMRKYSPLHHVRDVGPPLLLICGTRDGLYAQHKAFVTELGKVGARFDEITLDGASHGVENWEGHAEWMDYKTKLVEWLKAKLK